MFLTIMLDSFFLLTEPLSETKGEIKIALFAASIFLKKKCIFTMRRKDKKMITITCLRTRIKTESYSCHGYTHFFTNRSRKINFMRSRQIIFIIKILFIRQKSQKCEILSKSTRKFKDRTKVDDVVFDQPNLREGEGNYKAEPNLISIEDGLHTYRCLD